MSKSPYASICALVGVVLLSACGGGGNGASTNTTLVERGAPGVVVDDKLAESKELVFGTLLHNGASAVRTARQNVVRDEAAWRQLWQEVHADNPQPPPLPQIDFGRKMVIALFRGAQGDGCADIRIERTSLRQGKLLVEYSWRNAQADAVCPAYLPQPQHLAVVDRIEGMPEFRRIEAQSLPFSRMQIALSAYFFGKDGRLVSAPHLPFNKVIKDAASWQAIWSEVSEQPLPEIDFAKEMVIFAYGGVHSVGGCYASRVREVFRSGSQLYVARIDSGPQADSACLASFTAVGEMVKVARSEDAVLFGQQIAEPGYFYGEK
ncbi:hypothetical protein [Massilia sp. BJB1822]|uniref:hypothetical protein n=1 Tax=Massilia sp. BJB1822 TaxID=2744470 RepID=UPI001593E92B|nr:hypothetical protein [Massilia sp. BJB1822]NVD96593.1 hypothetical protein [Massilia sp. BJB1822]